ncbi:hypothetical protein JF544_08705 [Halobacillus kuroshimensis]|uniref:DUF8042 domain-containing protein n=1 Tax=Halobacillus kuroshimensis TaxID=302481 RepID=A0ABS3DVI6_9BACI|nr:hypothetical protein [Halobacillus kuroshimensis]MBN8235331.1 hypothetical protein [Halobacillus kuroshimensis]
MLRAYNELIHTTQEGLDYLTEQYAGLPSPQAPGVFQDVLLAFQQLNATHEKMGRLMKGVLLKDFLHIVEMLEGWFDIPSQEKFIHLTEVVLPAYAAWSEKTQSALHPYIVH